MEGVCLSVRLAEGYKQWVCAIFLKNGIICEFNGGHQARIHPLIERKVRHRCFWWFRETMDVANQPANSTKKIDKARA